MVRHNNMIPHQHFHKKWQRLIRVKLNDTGKKKARKLARDRKLKKFAPRPINTLRPSVSCPSFRYNTRKRLGRGFTLLELKKANVNPKFAKSVRITVDLRRKDRSVETLQTNVERLKKFVRKIMLVPDNKKPTVSKFPGIEPHKFTREIRKITDEYRQKNTKILHKARLDAKLKRRKQKKKKKVDGIEMENEMKK